MDRARAHQAIVIHVPDRGRRWFGLRRRCRQCGQPFPCPPQRHAVAVLAAPHEDGGQGVNHGVGAVTAAPESVHRPARPTWRCAACQDDWPCARRRQELTTEFAGQRALLALYLAQHLSEAIADHPDAVESALYLRFLGWFHDGRL